MMIKYPIFVDSISLLRGVSNEDKIEFLIEVFTASNHQHVIEAYKEVQQHNPDLFPPLLEEQ